MANGPAQTLAEAVTEAINTGSEELNRLAAILNEAESRLREIGKTFESGESETPEDGFYVLLDDAVRDLTTRLDESRRVASTFNIVFFGRTGAGKSTLLSALGRLNGELVSDGRSDFTADVQPLDWQGCRLYDTPGINGPGWTGSRHELEERARGAVEVADVVLLCFDTQSQQASEFVKVADWVRAYRKPVLAVLNIRNTMWRHPAGPTTPNQRAGLARAARQHADNIVSELEAIGLPGVPVVAINSKRGLFARASMPFAGPAETELEAERSDYGLEYLERWSNLPVLEQLVSACIVEGASDLRLAALREGFQAGLRRWADQLQLVAGLQTARGETLERKVAEWLEILGYLELEGRGLLHTGATDKDLLTQLEDARREPFTASVEGRLAGHVRHLLRSHLYPHRTRSLLAAENLIREAFDSQAQISDAEFASNVFDSTALSQSLAAVAQRAEEFVTASMEVASANAQIDLDLIDRSVFELRGKVGVARRRTATVLRTTGLLTSGASATLAVVALTNFWNPSGWAAAGILGGLGIASTVSNYLGRRTRRGAEERRAAARAGAIARARADINTFYDTCESEQLTQVVEESWRGASSPLADLLSEALRIRDGCATIVKEAVWLREEADRQPPTTSPAVVIYRATDRVVSRTAGWDQQGATALLLGEDWLIDPSQSEISPELSEIERQRFFEAARRQRAEFLAHLSDIIPATRAESIAHWLERAAGSEFLEPGTRKELHTARGLLSSQPTILVLGDYSSGKTTLIKRLLAEAGAETPATLRVEAGPATDDLERYQFGRLTLVDAPGFQSGDERLDALAVDASRDAALVIVVLHVNLLIGDPSRLAQLLLGDDTHIARTARTVFVIGRIDEVGADPQSAPADFLVRRRRKVEELHRILEASGLTSRPAQVFALSADPYGLVGDRSPVTSADYDSANKVWDGVNTLCEPLLVLDDERLGELSAEAALDRGRSTLASAHSLLADEIKGIERSQGDSDRLRRLTEASLAELRLLEQSIDRRTRRVVEDHAEEVLIEALGAGPDEVQAMAKRLESWWEDPRLEKAVESLAREVARDLTSWSQRHGSEFDRELARLGLATDGERSDSRDNDAGSGGGDGTQVAAQVVNQLANVVKAFGTRDAAYAFGKRVLDVKFKPWGAVKAGAKVAKIGAALGVVAVGFDIFAWVKDHKNETRREEARNAAVDHVRRTVDAVVASVLDDEDGPMDYVRQRAALITSHLKDFRAESEWRQRSVDDARQRLAAIAVLQQAGEALATGETERVTS